MAERVPLPFMGDPLGLKGTVSEFENVSDLAIAPLLKRQAAWRRITRKVRHRYIASS